MKVVSISTFDQAPVEIGCIVSYNRLLNFIYAIGISSEQNTLLQCEQAQNAFVLVLRARAQPYLQVRIDFWFVLADLSNFIWSMVDAEAT